MKYVLNQTELARACASHILSTYGDKHQAAKIRTKLLFDGNAKEGEQFWIEIVVVEK